MNKEIEDYLSADRKAFGLTLGERLKLFLRMFAMRKDIYVYGEWKHSKAGRVPAKAAFGKPTGEKVLDGMVKNGTLPIEAIAFISEINELIFRWDFLDRTSGTTGQPQGYAGGKFNFKGLGKWYPKPSYNDDFDYVEYMCFDSYEPEGQAEYSYNEGEARKDASLYFNYSNEERMPMDSLEQYLTRGASMAFTFYWQRKDGNEVLSELRKKSIPTDTPKDIIAEKLFAKGCTDEEAKCLVSWLGKDAVILVESD